MATALARPLHRPDLGPVVTLVPDPTSAPAPDPGDLDAAWRDAWAPHRLAEADTADVAQVPGRARVRVRRLVVLLVAVALAVGLAIAGGAFSAGPARPASEVTVPTRTVTVEPGQTLWEVAAAVTPPGQDVRTTVTRIRDLNGLTDARVPAWTSLRVPVGIR